MGRTAATDNHTHIMAVRKNFFPKIDDSGKEKKKNRRRRVIKNKRRSRVGLAVRATSFCAHGPSYCNECNTNSEEEGGGGGGGERERERVVEGEGGARSAGRRSRVEIGHRAV